MGLIRLSKDGKVFLVVLKDAITGQEMPMSEEDERELEDEIIERWTRTRPEI